MEKIVKYCSACDEAFSESYSFCPKCAAALTDQGNNDKAESPEVYKTSTLYAAGVESKAIGSTNAVKPSSGTTSVSHDLKIASDDDYHISLVEDTNGPIRHRLMLGAFLTVMLVTFAGIVFSIFNTALSIPSISDDRSLAYWSLGDPLIQEKEKLPKDDGLNGGGTSGKHELTPASQGEYASQTEDPMFLPSSKTDPVTNPDLAITESTKGPEQLNRPKDYGIPNSQFTIKSDGPGDGGGIGNRPGSGQGNDGDGAGAGPGIKYGRGGLGPGGGAEGANKDDDDARNPPPPRKIAQAMNIIFKPKALYTDKARQSAVQGVVSLRVTFLANGTIGNVVAISGLSDGLTEQAIAAAKNIKFEPQKINGVPQTVVRQVQYSFTLF